MFRFFRLWAKQLKRQLRIKRSLNDFPPSGPMAIHSAQIENILSNKTDTLVKRREFFISENAKITTEDPATIRKKLKQIQMKNDLSIFIDWLTREISWKPLDLPFILGNGLLDKELSKICLLYTSPSPRD